MSFQHVLVLTLIALLLGVRLAVAQSGLTSAEIRGVVTDPLGGVIAGSHITVTHLDTNVSRNVATDPNGRYTVPALPPGRYRLTATAAGFRTETRVGVGLSIGDSINIDVMLTTLTTELGVTVNATPPSIEPSHTAVSTVVGQEQIENLPINGRNFMTFAAITAGAALDRTPQQGATTTSGLSFTGQRARSNNIMIDGFDNNDNVVGATRLRTSQEAVREFRVLTDSFSAEFGRASGGVVNIVTKSGTNDFHGNTFMFVRDRSLNSRSYFEKFDIFGTPVALDKAPFDQQQLGATFGGPLRRNRAFSSGRTNVTPPMPAASSQSIQSPLPLFTAAGSLSRPDMFRWTSRVRTGSERSTRRSLQHMLSSSARRTPASTGRASMTSVASLRAAAARHRCVPIGRSRHPTPPSLGVGSSMN